LPSIGGLRWLRRRRLGILLNAIRYDYDDLQGYSGLDFSQENGQNVQYIYKEKSLIDKYECKSVEML
jgi:hypothetical protein